MPMNYGTNNSGSNAQSFENVMTQGSIPLVAKPNPYLMLCVGRMLGPDNPERLRMISEGVPDLPMFERLVRLPQVGGKFYEVKLLGEVEDWNVVGRNFDDLAAPINPSFTEKVGTAKFQSAMVWTAKHLDVRRWAESEGGFSKGEKPIVTEARAMGEGLSKTLSEGLNSLNDVAEDSIGGVMHAANSTGSYGGIDRADAGNANYVSRQYDFGTAAMTRSKIGRAITKARGEGGDPTIAPCTEEQFNDVADICDGVFVPDENEETKWLKGDFYRIRNCRFFFDPRRSDDTKLPMIDHRQVRIVTWLWPSKDGNGLSDFSFSDWKEMDDRVGVMQCKARMLFQHLWLNPKLCVQGYGIA